MPPRQQHNSLQHSHTPTPTPLPRNHACHESTTLMAILLILFGGMWLCWMWRLHPTDDTTANTSAPLRCHQVAPNLRSALLVFTALLLLSTVVHLGRTLLAKANSLFDTGVWLHRGVHLVLLLIILLMQMSYLLHMRKSKMVVVSRHANTPSAGGCSSSESGRLSAQRWVLVGFAVLQVGVGCWVVGQQLGSV
jgi:hypothetical protein